MKSLTKLILIVSLICVQLLAKETFVNLDNEAK